MAIATTTTARPRRMFGGLVGNTSNGDAAAGAAQPHISEARAKPTSKRSVSLWIILGTAATILSVVASAGLQLRKDHALALDQIERESRSFITVSGTLIASTLDRTQATLLAAAKVSSGAAVASDPALINVIAADAQGNVMWDRSGTSATPRRLTDRVLLQARRSPPRTRARFARPTSL